jgi:hypothetical protein
MAYRPSREVFSKRDLVLCGCDGLQAAYDGSHNLIQCFVPFGRRLAGILTSVAVSFFKTRLPLIDWKFADGRLSPSPCLASVFAL